jgi:hypothetical protein
MRAETLVRDVFSQPHAEPSFQQVSTYHKTWPKKRKLLQSFWVA